MTRVQALWTASPRKILVAIGALLLAVAVAVGSGANFNSTSANPGNVFSAGNLSHSNSKASAAILTATKMKPGDSTNGTVDIKNTGDVDGIFTLSKSNVTNTPASPAFSGKLDLKIEDLGDPACVSSCPAAVTKYSGKLDAMGSVAMGTFTPNENHRYKFTVTFPDGGTSGADNAYKGSTTSVQYDWESKSS